MCFPKGTSSEGSEFLLDREFMGDNQIFHSDDRSQAHNREEDVTT